MDRLGSMTLVWQPVEEKENFEFKPVKLRLKMTLWESCSWEGLDIYMYIYIYVCVCVWFDFFVKCISPFVGYLMPKTSLYV